MQLLVRLLSCFGYEMSTDTTRLLEVLKLFSVFACIRCACDWASSATRQTQEVSRAGFG